MKGRIIHTAEHNMHTLMKSSRNMEQLSLSLLVDSTIIIGIT
jgi:hypothetical protein